MSDFLTCASLSMADCLSCVPMSKVIFLHVGMPRCGTTALQFFAHDNAERLRDNGLHYPTAAEVCPSQWDQAKANGIGLSHRYQTEPVVIGPAFARMADQPFEKVLISSEFFAFGQPNKLSLLKSAADDHRLSVKPIIYLREQVEWLLSAYAQAVKKGQTHAHIADYLRTGHAVSVGLADYAKVCRNLAGVFGRENLIVRIYDCLKLTNGDVRHDMLRVTGTDGHSCNFAVTETNASISAVQIEAIRLQQITGPTARRFARQSAQLLKQMPGAPDLYRIVAPAQIAEVRRRHQDGNEWLRHAFFPERAPPLFRSAIPDSYEQIDGRCLQRLAADLIDATRGAI